jgi:serine/threonine protein phosphatase PrpC
MERSMKDGHPKARTIYLYNPNGYAHFSVLHADLDKRIFNGLSPLATSAVDTRKSYTTSISAPVASKPESVPTFTKAQVQSSAETSKAYKDSNPLLFAIQNSDPQVIWDIVFETETKGVPFLETDLKAINARIKATTSNDILQAIADYMRDKIDLEKEGIASQSNPPYKITIAETIGERDHQQDAIFVGEVQNQLAKTNPAEFYRRTLPAIIDDHKTCKSGSTLSSAITNQNADGSINITTANLGDSRVAVTLKYKKNGVVGYRSILLTEDHKPTLARVNAHIQEQGGSISKEGRVNSMLAVGGAIGDASVSKGKKDCLLRTPDIWIFNSKNFLKLGEILEDLDLIVGCDGLWDRSGNPPIMSTDNEFVLKGTELEPKNTAKNTFHLTNLRKEFDVLTDKSTYRDNFAYFLQQKAIDGGSTDNISASNITLVSEGKTIIPADKSVMLSVCDGHGGTPDPRYEDNKANLADLVKTADDGALVAASVAARLANAAEIKEIAGLEIQQQKQESLFLLKQQYSKEPTTIAETERQKSTTHATKKKNTPTPFTPDNDEGHTTKEGKSDDKFEVSSTFRSIEDRNNTTFAYTDREITAINLARNIEAGYKYFKNQKGEESGILLKNDNQPLAGSDGIQTIIEMPACAVDQGSPISLYLAAQLEHFKEFIRTNPDHDHYPLKILFPYKLKAWHWNVGEVTVTMRDGKLVLEGCAYDSMKRQADLEPEIQREILATFKEFFPGEISEESNLNKKSNSPQRSPQRGGIACGLYAALAMHNLKTKSATQVWDGANENEQSLRNKDSVLVFRHNPNSRFCEAINERGFVNIYKTAGTTSSNPTLSKKGSEKTPYQNMVEQLKTIEANKLKDIAAFAESLAFEKDSNDENRDKLFEKLKDNTTLQKIIFPNGDKSRTITNEQLANLALEATLIASTRETYSTPEETAYQHCIEIISGSFADAIRDCAIRSPLPLVEDLRSKETTDDDTDKKVAIKSFSEGLQRYINDTFEAFGDTEKKRKSIEELVETAKLVVRMICLEVQETRISEITKMKSNTLDTITKSTPLSEEAKLLINNFVRSNNPILEKDGKNYTPLEAAKERITEAKKKLHENLEEEAIKKPTIELGNSKEAKHTFSEKEIIAYSAKGILSKALRAKVIAEIAAKKGKPVNNIIFEEKVTRDYEEASDGSGNLKIQFGRRYVREKFVGDAAIKLKFDNKNFGNNSFANCTFNNCDFQGSSKKQLKFVNCTFNECDLGENLENQKFTNCTFDKNCKIPKNLKISKNTFLGCKFSASIFNGLDESKTQELKKKLGIEEGAEESEGYFSSKPNTSVTPASAFKLNPKMLTRE